MKDGARILESRQSRQSAQVHILQAGILRMLFRAMLSLESHLSPLPGGAWSWGEGGQGGKYYRVRSRGKCSLADYRYIDLALYYAVLYNLEPPILELILLIFPG